jgi:flagellar hook assembly protein FlgD
LKGGSVRLEIFDFAGRAVRRMDLGVTPAGIHYCEWDGRRAGGGQAGPGVYFVRLRVGEKSWTRELVRSR